MAQLNIGGTEPPVWVFCGSQTDAKQHWSQFCIEKYVKGNPGSGYTRNWASIQIYLLREGTPCVHHPLILPQHLDTNKSVQDLFATVGRKWEGQKPKYKLQLTKTDEVVCHW